MADKIDANEILQTAGSDALIDEMIELSDAAAEETAAIVDELEEKIEAWTADNGAINQRELEQLKINAEYLSNLTRDKITSTNAQESKTLKALARCRLFDFYRDAADSFLARAKAAKMAAAEKVKAATEDNPAADSDATLAMISISKIETEISKLVGKMRKDREDYLKKQEQAARLQLRALTREKTAENTTGKIFDDCPIDAQIPTPYTLEQDGIHYEGDCICSTPVTVVKILTAAQNEYLELAVYNPREKIWRKITVERIVVADARRILELANFSVAVTSYNSKLLSDYLSRQINFRDNINRIPAVKVYDKPGWHGDEFIYPGDATIYRAGADYPQIFSTAGDKAQWLDMFKRVTAASAAARLLIGAALAAPLIKLLNIRNMWLHLACKSGAGKSAVNFFAASIYGDPRRMITKFNSTQNALEASAINFNDFPSFVEELQTASKFARETMGDVVHNFETGTIRGRCAKTSALQPNQNFRSIRISTGEQTITNQNSGAGVFRRIVEFTKSKVLPQDLASEVHRFADRHYGLLGRDWIELIKSRRTEICNLFKHFEKKLAELYPAACSDHRIFVAAAYAAGSTFECELVLKSFDLSNSIYINSFVDEKNTADAAEIFACLPEENQFSNAERAIADVVDFVTSNAKFFPGLDAFEGNVTANDREPYTIYGYNLGGGSCEGNVAFLPKILRENVLAKYPSATAVIREFAEAGFLDAANSKDHPYQKQLCINGKTKKRQWFYVFKKSALYPSD